MQKYPKDMHSLYNIQDKTMPVFRANQNNRIPKYTVFKQTVAAAYSVFCVGLNFASIRMRPVGKNCGS